MESTSPCNSLRRYDMNGRFKYREVKTGFFRKTWMQTGSSGTLIGWKSGQTTYVPLWGRMEGAWLWIQWLLVEMVLLIYIAHWSDPNRFCQALFFCLGRDQSSFRLTAQANTYRVHSHAPSIRSHGRIKVVWPDFQPMRVPEEPVCVHLFRQKPVFTSLHLKSPVHVHRLSMLAHCTVS